MKDQFIFLQYVFYPMMAFFIGIFIKACLDEAKEKKKTDETQVEKNYKKSA